MPLEPEWDAPGNVLAFTTIRPEPIGPFELCERLPAHTRVQRLTQVHGSVVIDASRAIGPLHADACYSRSARLACLVVSADCLPLLVCNRRGSEVAAIHAGWRGLAAGVIEATLAKLSSDPGELMVWLGPAISQDCFEVGPEVRRVFLDAAGPKDKAATDACFRSGRDDRFMADLYQLARIRLAALGVVSVFGGGLFTYSDAERFHSYRREGRGAGRMASIISIR